VPRTSRGTWAEGYAEVFIRRNIEIFAKEKPEIHLSLMACLISYTAAIMGNLLLDNTRRPLGWIRPEERIYNERLDYLTDALEKEGVVFQHYFQDLLKSKIHNKKRHSHLNRATLEFFIHTRVWFFTFILRLKNGICSIRY